MHFIIPLALMAIGIKTAMPFAAELHWSFWLVTLGVAVTCALVLFGQILIWISKPGARAVGSYLYRVLMPMPFLDFYRLHEAHGLARRAIYTVVPECRPHAERTARRLYRQIQIERLKQTLMLR